MDTPNIQAAGSRPNKSTFDQAPQTRQVIQNKSDIFGVNTPAPAPQVSRQSVRPKTDIFSNESQAPKQSEVRQNKTFQSQIFQQEAVQNAPPPARSNQTFENSQQEVKRYQKKNNDNRQVDHGKDFLFGKSDFDEYKSLKRAATLSEFKPKLNYDPQNRRNKELYGNEIARDHLPTKEVNLETSSPQKPKKQQQQQQEQNPTNRKLMENQSSVFGESANKAVKNQKVEKLTASTQKWSTVGGQSNNQVKEFDPDTYAKNRKEAELQSSVFGEQQVKVQPAPIPEQQEESQTQQSTSQQQQKVQKPKERLIPNNQTWQQTDSVKNMRDFDPTQSQIKEDVDASQKKMDALKSAMDSHQFEAQQIPTNQKISNKHLKQKKDIIQREEKLTKEKTTTKTQAKKK
ncbi:unnamed protein product (macronuclear) [Paramecium tetraurelia]|uniref:Uncharacterized protein n=1 Tax=Paramecium tetraurelia TaxID=5888 RepID=A0BXC4_PARTE|nr:uncharacterized protein GSPATT00033044001 [Paramecium tetraurelia]CAK63191.1 unnamed protein product [Paramecium tetraurelia]|eukprot:XP_001430589.1 hypothetical protein (macronuclear) [Paramecium tetraurelia strain d4-2]